MSFTCISCRVAFHEADLQRAHYKTDWHRYNLKRKVAELPPVDAQSFQQKVDAQRSQTENEDKDSSSLCSVCSKHFSSGNQYTNHMKSKKHKTLAASLEKRQVQDSKLKEELVEENNAKEVKLNSGALESEMATSCPQNKVQSADEKKGDAMDDSDVESWAGDAIAIEECLFCSHVSKSIETNLSHMMRMHGFFVPDLDYVIDLDGLISYLGEKVGEGHICLWCNEKGKSFMDIRSVQKHMVNKGHCKIMFDGDAVYEYSDFYDYRKSYPDYKENPESDQAMEKDADEEQQEELEDIGFQLVLPSGNTVGHRSLQRYYRQKLKPDRPRQLTPVNKLMAQYMALGWTGSTGQVAKQRAKDMAFVQRIKQKQHVKLACKAHKLVNHYRDQIFSFG